MSDEELSRQLNESTKYQEELRSMSDEEYARALQEELNPSPITRSHSTHTPTFQPESTFTSSLSGTYAAPPPGESFGIPLQPTVNYDVPEIDPENMIAPPELHRMLVLTRRSMTSRILVIIQFMYSVYSVMFRAWWFCFGLVFAPVGFYGTYKYKKTPMLFYILYLLIDISLQILYIFLLAEGVLVALALLMASVEGFMVYYLYQFNKSIPRGSLA